MHFDRGFSSMRISLGSYICIDNFKINLFIILGKYGHEEVITKA
jgi:hypothetical protein